MKIKLQEIRSCLECRNMRVVDEYSYCFKDVIEPKLLSPSKALSYSEYRNISFPEYCPLQDAEESE